MFAFFMIGSVGAALGLLLASTLPADVASGDGVHTPPGVSTPFSPDRSGTPADPPDTAQPQIDPPEAWVPRQVAGVRVRTPADLADVYEEGEPGEAGSYTEYILWQSEDAERFITFSIGYSDLEYDEMLAEIEDAALTALETGIVTLQGVPFHALEVRDTGDGVPYLDYGYFAVEPNADGLRLEIFAGASVESPDTFAPVLRALMDSVTLTEPAVPDTDAGAGAAGPGDAAAGGLTPYTLGGVTIDIPADWPVLEQGDDEIGVGFMDESGPMPVGVAAGFMMSDETFDEFVAGAASDGIAVVDLGPVQVGDQVFRSFEATMNMGPMNGRMKGLGSMLPNRDGQYVVVLTTVMNQPWEDHAQTLEDILASARLTDDASFGPADGAKDDAQGGLGGLLAVTVPAGWQVIRDGETQVSIMAPGMRGYVLAERGDDARDTLDLTHAFADPPPTESAATILGQSARMFEGLTITPEVMDATGETQGIKRIHALATCLADGAPLSVTVVGAPDWLAEGGAAPMLDAMTLTLPEDAAPCAEDPVIGAPVGTADAADPGGATEPAETGELLAHVVLNGAAKEVISGTNLETHHAVPAPGRDGTAGAALAFDGSGWVQLDRDINPAALPQLTIAAWVRPDDSTTIQTIVSHDDGGFDRSLVIDHRGNGTGWSIFTGRGVLGALPLTPGQWTFVAGVWDQTAQTVRLHVDDAMLEAEGVTTGEGHGFLHIGHNPSYGEGFRGAVEEVWVYGHALSPDDLMALRQAGPPPVTSAVTSVPPAERAEAARQQAQTRQAEGDYLGALLAYRESMAAAPNDEIKARIDSLERYLKLKGIEVPPAD